MQRSVRATREEHTRPLRGDELIPRAIDSLTHAVTIQRPPRDVWPWIAQMGAGTRAGWYSYDFLDNGRRVSATRIVPELQHPAVGTVFPALPGVRDVFVVLEIEPERLLVLGAKAADGAIEVSWSFRLDEVAPGVTRLIVRARGGPGYRFHGLPLQLTRIVVRAVHYVMQRKQLLSIARRAETAASPGSSFTTAQGEAAFRAAYREVMTQWPVPYGEMDIPGRFGSTHVIVSGPRNAPPLVLVHGYMSTSTQWTVNIADFSAAHRVYALDVMGQPSLSRPVEPVRSAADYVLWLSETLDALQLDRVDLIGMSYGGWIALTYAAAEPTRVQKLVLLSPGGLVPVSRQFVMRGLLMMAIPARFTVNSFMRWLGFVDRPGRASVGPVLELMYHGVKHFRMSPETARVLPAVIADRDLQKMSVPTLVLFGNREVMFDAVAALDRACRLMPDVRAELIPFCSHDMCFSEHRIVDARVLQFLAHDRRHVPERVVA